VRASSFLAHCSVWNCHVMRRASFELALVQPVTKSNISCQTRSKSASVSNPELDPKMS